VSQISINVDIHVSICVSRARIYTDTDGYTLHEIAGVRFVFVLSQRNNIEFKSLFSLV